MERIAIIQLARSGDIVNILPVARELSRHGSEVTMYVHRDFAPILDAVSYLKPHVWEGTHRDVFLASEHARRAGFDRVIISQVDGNNDVDKAAMANFTLQSWANVGPEWVRRYHDLPLIFDRRDGAAEQAVLNEHIPYAAAGPILCYSLHGHSSPFAEFRQFEKWLVRTFAGQFRLLDIGKLELATPQLLLPLLVRATALITIDSLPLHLSYAMKTPTVALSRDVPWYQSEPRAHWLTRLTYEQALTEKGQREIAALLLAHDFAPGRMLRGAAEMAKHKEPITHVVNWVATLDKPQMRRIINARLTWDSLRNIDRRWEIAWHEMRHCARTSATALGDTRALPFIRDIIDYGAQKAGQDGIVVFTNSDVCLVPEAATSIRAALANAPCCYSRRVDVHDASEIRTRSMFKEASAHCGADLFAFRVPFWRQHGSELPDLLLSCEGWDFIARRFCEKYNPRAEMKPPIIYHEIHRSFWAEAGNIHANPGQTYNRRACREWAVANGFASRMYPTGSQFLFRADDE